MVNAGHAQIRILVADDHPVVREGIRGFLAVQPDIVVVAEASNGREAIQQFRIHRPDITLMDLQMPEMNGVDAVSAIRVEFPGAKIIILTTYAGDVQILRALKAGAQGYMLKDALHKELPEKIRAVYAGRKVMAPEAAAQIAEHSGEEALTPKELEVLRLIAAGNANKEIAAHLSISEESVKSRVKNILDKLGVRDRTHAVTVGLKRGIIEL
ncbi:MAG TPA: response regulator transcription factor [Candidatus Angelobacter sp.]|nr:response regulator transcription factor [Candidatus Angelobacter sp.]